MNIETTAVHGGYSGDSSTGSCAVPIYQTGSFAYSTADQLRQVFNGHAPGFVYSRISNPTSYALERRLAEMERGIGCIATSSGMAAINAVATGLLKSGSRIVAARGIFGGTVSLFEKTLTRFGVETVWVNGADSKEFKSVVNENTDIIFVEAIANPGMDVPDIAEISNIAKSVNAPLVIDATAVSPVLCNARKFGADIVIHSTSKYINGHGTAIGGAVIDTGNYNWSAGKFYQIAELAKQADRFAFLAHLRNLVYRDLGGCPAPMNSFLMLQGLETLSARMEIHCANARKLAGFLNDHSVVEWVNYPGLETSRFYNTAKKQFAGKGGGLLTFGVGSQEKAFRLIDSLKLAKNLANLGDAKTLVIHPASTIFHDFSSKQKAEMSITDDLIRVSAGIENIDDIKSDFAMALDAVKD